MSYGSPYSIERVNHYTIVVTFANFIDEEGYMINLQETLRKADEDVLKDVVSVIEKFDKDRGYDCDKFEILGSNKKTISRITNDFLESEIEVDVVADYYASGSTVTINWDESGDDLQEALLSTYIDQLYDHLEKEDIISIVNETASAIVCENTLFAPESEDCGGWDWAFNQGYYYDYADCTFVPISEASDEVRFRHNNRVLDAKDDCPLKQFVRGKEVNVA